MDSVKDHLQQKLKSKFVCFWSLRSTFKIFASFRNHRRAGLFLSNSNYNRYNSVNLNTTFDCHCGCISNTAIGNFKKVFVHFLCQNLFFCDSCRMIPKCHRLRVIPQPKGNKSGIKNKIFTLNTLKLFHLTYMTRAFLEISSDIHVLRYFLGFFKLTTKFCKCVVRRDNTKYPFSENHPYM